MSTILSGSPLNVTVPGPRELLMIPWFVRFTDATSNLGWSGAVWAATALIAESAMPKLDRCSWAFLFNSGTC